MKYYAHLVSVRFEQYVCCGSLIYLAKLKFGLSFS